MEKIVLLLTVLFTVFISGCNNEMKDIEVDTISIQEMLSSQQWVAKDTMRYVAAVDDKTPLAYYVAETHTLNFDDKSFTWNIEIETVINETVRKEVIIHEGRYSIDNMLIELSGDGMHYYATIDEENSFLLLEYINSSEAVVELMFESTMMDNK